MKILNDKMTKIFLIFLTLGIAGFAFYWYEWRPTQIRKKCFKEVISIEMGGLSQKEFNFEFQRCLHAKGL